MFDRMMKVQQLADAGFYRRGVPWAVRLAFGVPQTPFDLQWKQINKPNAVQIPCNMK